MSHDDSRGWTRRRALLGLGAGATVALAGCTSGVDDGADNVPVLGDPDADVVLEVYEDMRCPGCRSYVENFFEDIRTGYLDEGRIRYEHRDFIVTNITAAHAASAAREVLERHGNDAFWEFKSAVYANQDRLDGGVPGLFGEISSDLELDADAIERAGGNRSHQGAVDDDIGRGESIGVSSTPSFVIDEELVETEPETPISQQVATVMSELDGALA